jgi:hypothetical protein
MASIEREFFEQELAIKQAEIDRLLEWPGDPAYKTPSACNDDRNTWRVFHRDIPGRIIAEFCGDKAEEAAKRFCEIAGQ